MRPPVHGRGRICRNLRANDETRADGFPNLSMYFLNRVLRDDLQETKLGAVAEARKLQ